MFDLLQIEGRTPNMKRTSLWRLAIHGYRIAEPEHVSSRCTAYLYYHETANPCVLEKCFQQHKKSAPYREIQTEPIASLNTVAYMCTADWNSLRASNLLAQLMSGLNHIRCACGVCSCTDRDKTRHFPLTCLAGVSPERSAGWN